MLQAIIFDMDWVLVNSTPYIRQSFGIMLKKYWVDISKLDRKKYLWRRLAEQIQMWKLDFDIKKNINVEDFSREAMAYQMEFMKDELLPNPDIINLIIEAKNKNIKLAVGTWSTKQRAIDTLKLIWVFDYIEILITSEDVQNGKPHPEVFLKAAKLLNIQPENCIVIEDALNGIEAAKTAEMKVAGKVWPHHTKEELQVADLVFENFSEITVQDLENLF